MRPSLKRAAVWLLIAALNIPLDGVARQQDAKSGTRAAPRPDPKRAEKALQSGKTAEERGLLEEALADYDEAVRLNPRDAQALSRDALLRSRLVHLRVEEAEKLALSGDLAQAKQELRAALRIDPGNPAVVERLGQISEMTQSGVPAEEPRLAGIPQLRPERGTRNFDLRGDVQTAYGEVARAFGLKAIFDPELPARAVRLHVDGVDFATAIDILQTQTATFTRPIDAETMFVAADTPAKRTQYGLTVEQTFVLPDSVAPEEMSEILRILRDITSSTHLQLNTPNRTLTIRDSPQTVALTAKLLSQIEQARGELLLDIELLEVDRNKALQLGITPPASARIFSIDPNAVKSLEQATDRANLIAKLLAIFAAQGISSIPPILLFGGGRTTFPYTLPGAVANLSDALTLVRSGRRVLLRAQDGKPATFFVGDRFPITLSLLSSSLGATSFVPTVSSTLFPETDFTVGKTPVALVAQSFTSSGLRDLAVLNQADNTVTILLNQGSGNFAQATGSPYKIGASPSAISVSVSPATPFVQVNTSQSFTATLQNDALNKGVTWTLSGPGCSGAACGTLSNVTITSVTYTAPASVPTPATVTLTATSVSDTTKAASATITVTAPPPAISVSVSPPTQFLLVNTSQSFTATSQNDTLNKGVTWALSQSGANCSPACGSLSNQTTTSVTYTAPAIAPTPASVTLIATSVSDTTKAGSATITVTPPAGIATANVNSDNNAFADLLATDPVANNVTLLLGNGDGTFTLSTNPPIAVGKGPSGIVTADFNGDGLSDFAVANFTDSSISIFLGDGKGGFTEAKGSPFVLPSGEQGPTALIAGDFRNMSRNDLAVVNTSTNNVSILLSKGDGTFTEATKSPISVGTRPVAIATGNLGGNARADLAVVNQGDNTVSILLNNGDGTFTLATGSPFATATTPAGVATAVFTSTAKNDLVVTNQGRNTISVYLGLGSGTFASPIELNTPSGPTAIVAADVNGDGLPDVAITDLNSNQVSVFLDPSSFASSAGSFTSGQQPYPASEYVDLGVKIKATPTLHVFDRPAVIREKDRSAVIPNKDEVTLQLEFEIRALSGQSVNGIPILSNRTFTQSVRVKEDQTTLISGLFDQEETRTLSALPGLSQIPVVKNFFSSRNNQTTDNELLILVTPRRLRLPSRISKTIYAGRGGGSVRRVEGLPQPLPPPTQPPQPPQPPPQPPLAQPPQP